MTYSSHRRLFLILLAAISTLPADRVPGALPRWFEEHRVQAHFENSIQDDVNGLYRQLHPAIRTMGSTVLTRILKTTGEGAWWPTAAAETNPLLNGRDLGREIIADAHGNSLKVVAYYRIMCDEFIERNHPEWLCRDVRGNLVLEPRTRRRPKPEDRMHVICFNSPARELIKTRLIELADRGTDAIYFDSWHMPEVCTCQHCRELFEKETGHVMDTTAGRDSEEYAAMTQFVSKTLVRTFSEWKRAVTTKHPDVFFAIGSSLYPCFDRQMQLRAALMQISDTSKTEFSKPFGGMFGWPMTGELSPAVKRQRPYWTDAYAMPAYDVQNALGWSLTRDSCDGRPPLMWIPFTRTETEALFSAAAAVSYGCIASIHPTGLWDRRARSIQPAAAKKYASSYALDRNVSPWLAETRPWPYVLIHISERSRDARIGNPSDLWADFFAPILGAFETLKETHWPVATINDLQLEQAVPTSTRVVILPHEDEISQKQQTVLAQFESAGGVVIPLDSITGWHFKQRKPDCKRSLMTRIRSKAAPAPIRVDGPARMHAVFYRKPNSDRFVVCLMNDFGWFHVERSAPESETIIEPPSACSDVIIQMPATGNTSRRVLDAVTGTDLAVQVEGEATVIRVPEFPVTACIVIDGRPAGTD